MPIIEKEKILPLTMSELQELVAAVPPSKQDPDMEVMIVANEERVCLLNMKTRLILSWIQRHEELVEYYTG